MPEQQRQITMNDIIHSDERVVNLKKEYNEYLEKKNLRIIEISHVEANIIASMGAFEYLNNFTDVDEARKELLAKFLPFVVQKATYVKEIDDFDKKMEACTGRFEALANSIVEDVKKAMEAQRKALDTESAPESDLGCPCGEGCDCATKENQVCDHCQKVCNGAERKDIVPPDETVVPGPESSR